MSVVTLEMESRQLALKFPFLCTIMKIRRYKMAKVEIKCRRFNATVLNVLCVYKGLTSDCLCASKLFASIPVVYQSWFFLLLLESHMFLVRRQRGPCSRSPGVWQGEQGRVGCSQC